MSGIVIFMLSTGTAYVVVMMRFLMIQIPSVMSPETPNTIVRQMRKYTVGFIWLIRLNVNISLRFEALTLILTSLDFKLVLPQ